MLRVKDNKENDMQRLFWNHSPMSLEFYGEEYLTYLYRTQGGPRGVHTERNEALFLVVSLWQVGPEKWHARLCYFFAKK